jgi:hypothetical protein
VLAQGHVPHDGQLGLGEQPLHHVFVHADGRAEHASPHVGQAHDLEHALDGAVFSHGAVQHGEHHVDALGALGAGDHELVLAPAGELEAHLGGGGLAQPHEPRITLGLEQEGRVGEAKAPLFVDAHEHGLVALGVERARDEARREQRDLVLGRATSEEHGHTNLASRHGGAR